MNPLVERHPLEPFLPDNCIVLFLGSFPPQRKRWAMEFFYPNFINDHWRIEGLVWFNDKNRFVDMERKTFKLGEIKALLLQRGMGYYDTATAVRRLADNASDKFLEVVEQTDIDALIAPLKELRAIAVTGEKACQTICSYYSVKAEPKTNTFILLPNGLRLYRLPSSSRAYPLSLEKKAAAYKQMFVDLDMLHED
ncbi:MAG: uracil-DNA glycosylase family protein [Bacteroidaceae bacterium]|nr:uracil-DNA glycosylase family protein [Bacteroidaceae bacterium]